MNTVTNNELDAKEYEERFKLLYIVVGISALLIISRLWFLQIIKGDELKTYSDKNRLKETKILAPRGLILDRNGQVLVENLPGFEATIIPQYTSDLEETAKAISPILKIPEANIINAVKKSKYMNGLFMPVKIKENLSLDEVYRIKLITLQHPGLNINPTIIRHYPLTENGAQLFGYVGEISKQQIESYKAKFANLEFEPGDIIGKNGLESVWENYIHGTNGIKFNEVDARGRGRKKDNSSKLILGIQQKEAIPGKNIMLTIDKDIQIAAHKAMMREDHLGPRIGGLVVMKNNGEILAWVNTPSFDPNEFSTGISSDLWRKLINDPNKPLRNKIIQDHYSPGSTFKPFVALAALQEGIIDSNTLVFSPAQWRFGNRFYHDHSKTGYGNINVYEAIERSSNVFFYKMGDKLGINNIAKYTKLLGLGELTRIQMEDEKPGLIPTTEWKQNRFGEEWQPGENLSNAIGQGFVLTTALQMAVAYNAIGMDGKVYKPHLVKTVLDINNNVLKEFEPELVRDVSTPNAMGIYIEKKNFETVKEGMRRVANGEHGTAKWHRIPGIEMAGKTGTVQIQAFSADKIYDKCDRLPREQRHHGWFGAFAPAKDPEITVVALTEHTCSGSGGSAPVVRDVMQAYFEKYHPDWIKTKKQAPIKKVAQDSPTPEGE